LSVGLQTEGQTFRTRLPRAFPGIRDFLAHFLAHRQDGWCLRPSPSDPRRRGWRRAYRLRSRPWSAAARRRFARAAWRDAELARVAADLGDEEAALDAGHGGGRERGGVGVFAELASGLHAGQAVAQVRFPAFEAGGDRWKPRTPPSARRGRRHLSYDSCPRAHRTAPLPPGSIRCGSGLSQAVRRRYTSRRTAVSGLRRRRVGLGPYGPSPGPATPARHHSLK
jgi:hypothetical protein